MNNYNDIYDKYYTFINDIRMIFVPQKWNDIMSITDDEIDEYDDELILLINEIPIYDAVYIGMIEPKTDVSVEERIFIIYYEKHYYLVDREDRDHAIWSIDITKFKYIIELDRKNKLKKLST